MKILFVLFFAVAAVSSFPADVSDSGENSDERPAFFIPTVARRPVTRFNPSVVEVDVGADSDADEDEAFFTSFFRPIFYNPFAGIRFPDFFSRPDSWFDSLTPKVGSEAEVKNATSTTKVVNGHKVVVNDTTYEDEKTGAVFKFHSIQIFPVDSAEGTDGDSKETTDSQEKTGKKPETSTEVADRVNTEDKNIPNEDKNVSTEETSSSKPDNNSADNEINREEFGEPQPEVNGQDDTSSPVEIFEVLQENEEPQKFTDLSGDIRVNRLMSEQGQQLIVIPEDVELLPETMRLTESQNAQKMISTDENYDVQVSQSEFASK